MTVGERIAKDAALRIALAQMYLDAEKFPALASQPEVELRFINIREWLGVKFGLKTIRTSNRFAVIELTEEQAKAAGHYYMIHATAFSAGGSPVYFQLLLVPVSACILEF